MAASKRLAASSAWGEQYAPDRIFCRCQRHLTSNREPADMIFNGSSTDMTWHRTGKQGVSDSTDSSYSSEQQQQIKEARLELGNMTQLTASYTSPCAADAANINNWKPGSAHRPGAQLHHHNEFFQCIATAPAGMQQQSADSQGDRKAVGSELQVT